jgi:S-DNA-T family DNA segregation ATPase FtsK/SpoIIIE
VVNPEHVAAPAPPSAAPPYSFPLLATIAPVVVSLALWGITDSVFALVFAALGPAVAVASLADSRLQSRRTARREGVRFADDLAAARAEIAAAHRREAAELAAEAPSAARLVAGAWPESEQWIGEPGGEVPVTVGRGERASRLVLDGATGVDRSRSAEHASLRDLAREAGTLRDAPVVVDARLGIGVLGRAPLSGAVARGLVLQVLATLSPADHEVEIETARPGEWEWLRDAPHSVAVAVSSERGCAVRVRRAGAGRAAADAVLVAVADARERLPHGARVVIEVAGAGARVAQHPDRRRLGPLAAEPVSRAQAVAVVSALATQAARSGVVGSGSAAVPSRIAFEECGARADRGAAGLSSVVAISAAGPLRLDLVAQGPHAVVGGTTGSGKSELLVGWVLAMASAHSPLEFTVLLVDFKGGSAFAGLVTLPHCVGMITDLDEEGAARALESLAAELRRRERHLAASGAKSVDALPAGHGMPRLVIVVDEFAAMVAGFPGLHALFADIAARGRSLGVHLVLCTQRPAGVIRDAVLANCALRLSLRVNNRPDSVAVIGTDAAATLPVEPRGRGWVAVDGGEPVLAQFPLVVGDDIERVRSGWSAHTGRPHRPWLDPLPAIVSSEHLAQPRDASGVAFGVLDDPSAQAQPPAVYRPLEHGNLLVVGGAGSGKSTLLATLAGGPLEVRRVPADIEGAWDALTGALADVRDPAAALPRLLLLDDLDALLPRLPEEYEAELLSTVSAVLREGPARGIHVVVTAQRLTPGLQAVAALCGSRIHLRMPSRQELVLAGGDGAHHADRLPPGGGHWGGLRLQVATGVVPVVAGGSAAPPPGRGRTELRPPLAVVARDPAGFAARLAAGLPALARPGAILEVDGSGGSGAVSVGAGPRALAVVGDLDAWQARWGALGSLRSSHTVVVDGYSAGEFRMVTRERELPPPLAPGGASFWVLRPGGRAARGWLPRSGHH